ncbi:hypothetical protein JCGZ_17732 [Jatropha curcas]|uniref:Protein kinase domain-containing protein n=1 Tax=Jatropha curcas TaxID=180498 RepID=A0A067K446_JATCU|nr:hypothetical protein JCGZ_17732 [Jatropha curcas]
MIDLKSLDKLDRHLDRVLNMQNDNKKGVKEKWEIDPKKLTVKHVVARGTYVKVLDWGDEEQQTKSRIATLRKEFKQEISVLHNISHPNITQFIGAVTGTSEIEFQTQSAQIGTRVNICCLVTEYQSGGTLKSYLIKNRIKKLPFKNVMQLALDLARGLSYLHSKNIVHRDLKTENILLDENQTIKIADFGVSRLEALNPSEMTGYTGSLGYMAPEVFNSTPYNRKCDVYSFGICLWEIYCCDMPFPNNNFAQLSSAVVYKKLRPKIPRYCPRGLAKIMRRCWDTNPNKRPEMQEVVTMLEAMDASKGRGMTPLDRTWRCFCWRL